MWNTKNTSADVIITQTKILVNIQSRIQVSLKLWRNATESVLVCLEMYTNGIRSLT